MIHPLPAEMDLGDTVVTVPFRFRHEAEQQVQHLLVFDIEEMSAADVKRRAIHGLAPAQSTGRGFFFQDQDFGKRHAAIQQGVRQRQPARSGSKDDIAECLHEGRARRRRGFWILDFEWEEGEMKH